MYLPTKAISTCSAVSSTIICIVVSFLVAISARGEVVAFRPVLVEKDGYVGVEYWSGKNQVARLSDSAPAGVELKTPDHEWVPVKFQTKRQRNGVIEIGPERIGTLILRWRIEQKTPSLIERTLEVTADRPQQFTLAFPLDIAVEGEFTSFTGQEDAQIVYDTLGGGPEYPNIRGQMIPVGMVRAADRVFGIVADTPGLWENRCLIELDPKARRLSVMCGDGRSAREVRIVNDARDKYIGQVDGWQTLAAGETRRFVSWVFASSALSHYDAQLAVHMALANGKGWNSSALEAILRNTAYINLRRNLLRSGLEDGRFIFTSGIVLQQRFSLLSFLVI